MTDEVITHLDMAGPDRLRPAAEVPGVVLEPVAGSSPLIRPTQARVGAPHGWSSTAWSEEQWRESLEGPHRYHWLVRYGAEVAGLVSMEAQPDGNVEITTFGLVPEFVGRGIGGYALTLAVRLAWRLPGARRVWLHTSSKDHPNALPNYRARGFEPFHVEVKPAASSP